MLEATAARMPPARSPIPDDVDLSLPLAQPQIRRLPATTSPSSTSLGRISSRSHLDSRVQVYDMCAEAYSPPRPVCYRASQYIHRTTPFRTRGCQTNMNARQAHPSHLSVSAACSAPRDRRAASAPSCSQGLCPSRYTRPIHDHSTRRASIFSAAPARGTRLEPGEPAALPHPPCPHLPVPGLPHPPCNHPDRTVPSPPGPLVLALAPAPS